jgi:3-deoxy-7-phosphoheptulonate synthase
MSRKVRVGPYLFGGSEFIVIAGPCSIESFSQFHHTSLAVQDSGAHMLRGGLYKMRTDPRSFQGFGSEAVEIVARVKELTGMPFVTEVSDPRQVEELQNIADLFQVGTRSMYNSSLLKELGRQRKPVILKRAFSALIEEWLLAADYIRHGGNNDVILCERGIRTFERATRNTLDLSAVPYIKQHSDLPIVVDPSHGTGIRSLIEPMARAAAAVGADGLLVEVHPQPEKALSDGPQALTPADFENLMKSVERVLHSVDRRMHPVPKDKRTGTFKMIDSNSP